MDLRDYRPADHRAYLGWLGASAEAYNVKEQIYSSPHASLGLLKTLNFVRMFRDIHWEMTKAYIIKQTKHPVATGGTPITSWLPNQLGATMEYQEDTVKRIEELGGSSALGVADAAQYDYMRIQLLAKLDTLKQEVAGLQKDEGFDKEEQELSEFEERTR